MDYWNIIKVEGFHDTYYKTKVFNGTDYRLEVHSEHCDKSVKFWINVGSGNKRKHSVKFEENTSKRNGGIEALVWIKDQMFKFPSYYRNRYHVRKDQRLYICVGWSDNRRRDIYCRFLKKDGFRLSVIDKRKVLLKKL
jgi:hypothetical protein